jgi:hypothetical protein
VNGQFASRKVERFAVSHLCFVPDYKTAKSLVRAAPIRPGAPCPLCGGTMDPAMLCAWPVIQTIPDSLRRVGLPTLVGTELHVLTVFHFERILKGVLGTPEVKVAMSDPGFVPEITIYWKRGALRPNETAIRRVIKTKCRISYRRSPTEGELELAVKQLEATMRVSLPLVAQEVPAGSLEPALRLGDWKSFVLGQHTLSDWCDQLIIGAPNLPRVTLADVIRGLADDEPKVRDLAMFASTHAVP